MSRIHFDEESNTLFIPEVKGVQYSIDGQVVSGEVVIDEDTIVSAVPTRGNKFPEGSETEFLFEVNKSAAPAEPFAQPDQQ